MIAAPEAPSRSLSKACASRPASLSPRDKASLDEYEEGFEEITSDEPEGDEYANSGDHCYDEYLKIIAACRKLPKKVDRAICYAAAMDWYVNCKFPMPSCKKSVTTLHAVPIVGEGSSRSDDESTCDTDPGSGGSGGTGGGTGEDCQWEDWEISYDGGMTWEYWGTYWVCYEDQM
jgi:hypothetical protein